MHRAIYVSTTKYFEIGGTDNKSSHSSKEICPKLEHTHDLVVEDENCCCSL